MDKRGEKGHSGRRAEGGSGAAGKPLATPDATRTQGAQKRSTSLHDRLKARIEHARACTANMQASLLLEICCLKKASRCRSVGVKMGPAPAPGADTASALRAARLVNASHNDFTQLDPTDAIGAVAEAARTFSKVGATYTPLLVTSHSVRAPRGGRGLAARFSVRGPPARRPPGPSLHRSSSF